MEIDELIYTFQKIYGKGSVRVFIAPARVNLIGEYTDFNGGYVLPCALNMRSACVIRRREDGMLNLASTSYKGIISANIEKLDQYKKLEWGSYQLGVAYAMQCEGYNISGCDMLFDETVPHGSGLSSSAAIEVASALAFAALDKEISKRETDLTELSLIGQKAENEYVGMNCGIMDQFASAMGKKDNAVLLKCKDLSYSYIPFDIKKYGYSMVITNTNKPRSLITSKYNDRRIECERALSDIQRSLHKVTCLADLTEDLFEEVNGLICRDTDRKRAEHIIYENERTKKSANMLKKGDVKGFGKMMCESHISLRNLFEVTGKELDILYDLEMQVKGVIGSRMTGAGFGGCTVSIVESERVIEFQSYVKEKYIKHTGMIPQFYISDAEAGAREEVI